MMNLNDFLSLNEEQELDLLVKNYLSMENAFDRYRAMCAVMAMAIDDVEVDAE